MKLLDVMILTDRDFVVRCDIAETKARNGQSGSSHQRANRRRDAVDVQDVFNSGIHTVAMKQKAEK